MAAKPTIYKLNIAIADLDNHYYDTVNLTAAQHPSETIDRMMVRVLAYCCNVQQGLEFTKGLYEPEEPDLWVKSLSGELTLWVDVGEPAPERIKKASRKAGKVLIYSFNRKADVWWQQNQRELTKHGAIVRQFDHQQIKDLTNLCERTMEASLTLSDNTVLFSTQTGACDLSLRALSE